MSHMSSVALARRSLNAGRTKHDQDSGDSNTRRQDFNISPWTQKAMSRRKVTTLDDQALYDGLVRSMTCKLDPFDTASVYIDRTVHALLHYYLHCYHPNIWRYDATSLPNKPSAFQLCINRRVAVALKDTLLMKCLLSAAASRVQWVDKTIVLPGAEEQEASSMDEALDLIQTEIKHVKVQNAPWIRHLATCIVFLASAEGYRGNLVASRTHVEAAVRLLEPIGGVKTLEDPYLWGQLLSLDNLLSCGELRPCSIKCDYDPGSASNIGLEESQHIRNEATSLWMTGTLMLPLSLMWLMSEILECQSAAAILRARSSSFSQALAPTDWATMRTLAIRSRLLATVPADARMNAFRVTLIMWTLLSTEEMRQAIVAGRMALKLKDILEETLDWTGLEDVKCWVLLMGYFCAGEDGVIQSWFAAQIRVVRRLHGDKISISPQGASWQILVQDLIALQQRFLYHEPVQRPLTEKLTDWLTWWDEWMSS